MDKDLELQKLGEEANALMLVSKDAAENLGAIIRQLDNTLDRVYYVAGHRFYKEFPPSSVVEFKNGRLKLFGAGHEVYVEMKGSDAKKLAYAILESI